MTHRRTSAPLWDILNKQGLATGPRPVEKVNKKRVYKESQDQIAFYKWWDVMHATFKVKRCLCYAVPNGSALGNGREDWQIRQRIIRGKRAKDEGVKRGVFDNVLAVVRRDEVGAIRCPGLYFEMKKSDKEDLRPDQIEFKAAVEEQGYKTAVCYSTFDAINAVTTYLTK